MKKLQLNNICRVLTRPLTRQDLEGEYALFSGFTFVERGEPFPHLWNVYYYDEIVMQYNDASDSFTSAGETIESVVDLGYLGKDHLCFTARGEHLLYDPSSNFYQSVE